MTDIPSWAKVGVKCTPTRDFLYEDHIFGPAFSPQQDLPAIGGVYSVSEITFYSGSMFISLEEFPNILAFDALDFRPLTSTKTEAEDLAYFTPFLSTDPSEADRIEREAQDELVDLALVQVNALWGKGA